ncbi:MAG: tRNA cytosine(34) acetyltransferase TmcA [Gammaproteobacteria bacterium]|nr:MAG: tRNA cytosine(34) acetyltransferase TmcA [Gammaproteobacteria bacterium]
MELPTLKIDRAQALSELATVSKTNRHRSGLILTGSEAWCLDAARDIYSGSDMGSARLWIGTHPMTGFDAVAAKKAHQVLGQTYDVVVFNGRSGFDVDALGAVSGTIRGGGQLCLLMPPFAHWSTYADPVRTRFTAFGYSETDIKPRWFSHLQRSIAESTGVLMLDQTGVVRGRLPRLQREPETDTELNDADCVTSDQVDAVEAVIRAATGQRRKPAILISDRGRGKSAALGIAAARLLRQGRGRIVVTGPQRETVTTLLDHAARLLPEARRSKNRLRWCNSSIEFLAPDRISDRTADDTMVMIDEAAAIPLPLLTAVVKNSSRLALATTVHGYEGTGRGFELRFGPLLSSQMRGERRVTLITPVRWAAGDPLERFIFRALMLDAGATTSADRPIDPTHGFHTERLDRHALVQNRNRLDQLFGLLVASHYRTRPSDLRYLLDAPGVSVYGVCCQSAIVGAALVVREGGLAADLARDVIRGRRRPRGHLLPVSIGTHLGIETAPQLTYQRIVRIAVRPELRRQGLGSRLINCIAKDAHQTGHDCLGVSFAADLELVDFWSKAAMQPIRLGVTQGKSSGANALLMLTGLTTAGEYLTRRAAHLFSRRLPDQLADPLRKADPSLVLCLLNKGLKAKSPDPDELLTASAFAAGQRGYAECVAELVTVSYHLLTDQLAGPQDKTGALCLVLKVLQKRSWADCAAVLGLAGRNDVTALLQRTISTYCEAAKTPTTTCAYGSPGSVRT